MAAGNQVIRDDLSVAIGPLSFRAHQRRSRTKRLTEAIERSAEGAGHRVVCIIPEKSRWPTVICVRELGALPDAIAAEFR
jgi:hypothetical protein